MGLEKKLGKNGLYLDPRKLRKKDKAQLEEAKKGINYKISITKEKFCDAFFNFFGNKIPVKQFSDLLNFNKKVLTKEFKDDIADVLERYLNNAYNPCIFEKRKPGGTNNYNNYKKECYKITKHHLVPKSRGGSNEKINILKIKQNKHRDFHIIFGNEHPLEQFLHLIKHNKLLLTEELENDIIDVLTEYLETAYKSGVLKENHPNLYGASNTKIRFPR